jgi:peroxiredoxin
LKDRSGDLAIQTNRFLEEQNVRPLSGSLERLLGDATAAHVLTQGHPLLGKPCPDFELRDHLERPWRLGVEVPKGPVVLVFYYGYICTHCVGQLFALDKDVDKFRELGAQIVAVSPDRTDLTRERFSEYGPFHFPVLSDPDDRVSSMYGASEPGSNDASVKRRHGTFLISPQGIVTWCYLGDQPFTDNRTLLYEIARLQGRVSRNHP